MEPSRQNSTTVIGGGSGEAHQASVQLTVSARLTFRAYKPNG